MLCEKSKKINELSKSITDITGPICKRMQIKGARCSVNMLNVIPQVIGYDMTDEGRLSKLDGLAIIYLDAKLNFVHISSDSAFSESRQALNIIQSLADYRLWLRSTGVSLPNCIEPALSELFGLLGMNYKEN